MCSRSCAVAGGELAAVHGFASADESSEEDSCSYTSHTSSNSDIPSLYSTGSFHHHPVPSNYNLPICLKCRRPCQFGQHHSDNHNCDCPDCIHGDEVFLTGTFAFHCAHCDFDICVSCHPINWVPESSLPDSLASDLSSFQMPADHSQSSQPHGTQALFSTPDDLKSPFRLLSTPPDFVIPSCPYCSHPIRHVLFQTNKFSCRGEDCILGYENQQAHWFGWHCTYTMCDRNFCTSCIPIDWMPNSTATSQEDPSRRIAPTTSPHVPQGPPLASSGQVAAGAADDGAPGPGNG